MPLKNKNKNTWKKISKAFYYFNHLIYNRSLIEGILKKES